jgi:ABC-type sugar transport system substrate-binding protein
MGYRSLRRLLAVVSAAVAVIALAACGSSSGGGTSTGASTGGSGASTSSGSSDISGNTLAFSQGSLSNEWRVVDTQSMKDAGQQAGMKVDVVSANEDPAKQLSDTEALLAKKPDVLVISPVEFQPLAPVPKLADQAHVPLIVMDRALPGTPGKGMWITLLTYDYAALGKVVGDSVVQWMTKKNGSPKGRLLHITGTAGASPVLDEQKGLDEAFKANPNIKIVGSCDGKYTRDGGRTCMEDLLQRFPVGSVDGLIADNDDEALGAIQALKAANRTDLLGWIWGKDATRSGLEAILAGDMKMTRSDSPFYGPAVVDAYKKYKAGEKLQPIVYLPQVSYDADTAANKAKVKATIAELKAAGRDCCAK